MKTLVTLVWVAFLTLSILLLNNAVELIGQPALPSPPSQAPIDGGLGILAAAGAAYALKKFRGRKNAG